MPSLQRHTPKARTTSMLASRNYMCSNTQALASRDPPASADSGGLNASKKPVTAHVSVRRRRMAAGSSCILDLENRAVGDAPRCASVRDFRAGEQCSVLRDRGRIRETRCKDRKGVRELRSRLSRAGGVVRFFKTYQVESSRPFPWPRQPKGLL